MHQLGMLFHRCIGVKCPADDGGLAGTALQCDLEQAFDPAFESTLEFLGGGFLQSIKHGDYPFRNTFSPLQTIVDWPGYQRCFALWR